MRIRYIKSIYFYLYILITIALFSILNLFLVSSLVSNAIMNSYYNSVEYDFTLTLDNHKQDSYYIIDEDYVLEVNSDASFSGYIKAISLMQTTKEYANIGYYKESNILSGNYKRLGAGECSITNNIAIKYKLSIGDRIYSVQDKKIHEEIIVNILKDTYNFLTPKVDTFEAYIFSGYDETKIDVVRYLSFAKYDDMVDKNASDHCFTKQIINETRNIMIIEIMVICIVMLLDIIIYFILNRNDALNMVRLHNLGYKNKKLILYLSIEFIITFGILMIGSIGAIIQKLFIYYLIEIFTISLIIYLINIIKTIRRI